VRLNLETPNFIYIQDYSKDVDDYDLVLHLCPYTCNYLNAKYNTQKFQRTFFPIDLYECKEQERPISVFYTGNVMNQLPLYHVINAELIRRLGVSQLDGIRRHISAPTYEGYVEKLNILNKTKICIAHNVLASVNFVPQFYSHKDDPLAKEHLPWHTNGGAILPQLKSRIFEGALMGCVLLVYKDNYKTIEEYFTEGEEFVYFTDSKDLRKKVDLILSNYEDYIPMAKRAQQKVREKYSSKAFLQMIAATLSKPI
jgi:glycosyltransferase involved in cell wall biosynthesis